MMKLFKRPLVQMVFMLSLGIMGSVLAADSRRNCSQNELKEKRSNELNFWQHLHEFGVATGDLTPQDMVCTEQEEQEFNRFKDGSLEDAQERLAKGVLEAVRNHEPSSYSLVGDINLMTPEAKEEAVKIFSQGYPSDEMPQRPGDQDREKLLHKAAEQDREILYKGTDTENRVSNYSHGLYVGEVVKGKIHVDGEHYRNTRNCQYANLYNAFLVCQAAHKTGVSLSEQEAADCKKMTKELFDLKFDSAVNKYGKDYQFTLPEFEKVVKAGVARRMTQSVQN